MGAVGRDVGRQLDEAAVLQQGRVEPAEGIGLVGRGQAGQVRVQALGVVAQRVGQAAQPHAFGARGRRQRRDEAAVHEHQLAAGERAAEVQLAQPVRRHRPAGLRQGERRARDGRDVRVAPGLLARAGEAALGEAREAFAPQPAQPAGRVRGVRERLVAAAEDVAPGRGARHRAATSPSSHS